MPTCRRGLVRHDPGPGGSGGLHGRGVGTPPYEVKSSLFETRRCGPGAYKMRPYNGNGQRVHARAGFRFLLHPRRTP